MSSSALKLTEEVSDLPPRIPEGEYRLRMVGYSTAIPFGDKAPRLFLDFTVCDMGNCFGVPLRKFYNVAKLTTKAGKNGGCKHKPRGDFLIDYFTLFPGQKLKRFDRIPMGPLLNSIIIGRVRDVTKNSQQKELPDQLKYSVIAKLVGAEK